MVTIKCRKCGAVGFKFCTHGKKSRKSYIQHKKKCKTSRPVKRRRKQNATKR